MSGEGMSTDRAPFFDGTGFPRWKVLMQAHLQARGLDVWRVTEEGKKNENKAERQYDAIAKSILLSSLCDSVFNRVFANENAHKLMFNPGRPTSLRTAGECGEASSTVAKVRSRSLLLPRLALGSGLRIQGRRKRQGRRRQNGQVSPKNSPPWPKSAAFNAVDFAVADG